MLDYNQIFTVTTTSNTSKHAYNKSKMADGRHFKKLKNHYISAYRLDRSA